MIIVCKKPSNVSWDTISNVLQKAHKNNEEKGFVQKTANISGKEIEERVRSGQCFVAMDGDKIVGTLSVAHKYKKSWFVKGEVLYYMLLGILPEYQGRGIYSKLIAAREEYAKTHNFEVTYMYTSENNKKMQQLAQKEGFHFVSYSVSSKTNYYSVVMAKWQNTCPFPDWYFSFRYQLSKYFIRFFYKRGAVKRFKILP